MARKLAAVMILLLALALWAGCSAPGSSGGSQQAPAQGGSRPQAPGSTGDFSPGPVVTIPPDYFVDFQVNKNMIFTNPAIDVFFAGGKGQIFLQRMLVQVQMSDGRIESKELARPEGGQIAKGEKLTFRGTTGTDRVVITFTILGKDYKVHDQLYEFKTRP
jgi:hypothetical protein